MRIAKISLMLSLSVFLVTLSWFLVTGRLGEVAPAQAQIVEGPYQGPPIVYVEVTFGPALFLIDSEGWLWRGQDGGGGWYWERLYQAFGPGTPIPTGSQTLSDLKRRYGDN